MPINLSIFVTRIFLHCDFFVELKEKKSQQILLVVLLVYCCYVILGWQSCITRIFSHLEDDILLNKFNNKIHFTHDGLFHVLKDKVRIDIHAPNGKYRKGIIVRKYVQHDGNNNGTTNSSLNNSGTASDLIVSTSNDATIYTVSPPGSAPSSGQFIAAIGDDNKDGEHRFVIQNNKSNKNNQTIQIHVQIDIFELKEETVYIDPLFTIQSNTQSNKYQLTTHVSFSKRPNLSYKRTIVPHLRAHRKKTKHEQNQKKNKK